MTEYKIIKCRGWEKDDWKYYYKIYRKTDGKALVIGSIFALIPLLTIIWAYNVTDISMGLSLLMATITIFLFIQGLSWVNYAIGEMLQERFKTKKLAQKYINGLKEQ